MAVKFVVEAWALLVTLISMLGMYAPTASVANGVPSLVTSPQWRNGSAAVLACYDHRLLHPSWHLGALAIRLVVRPIAGLAEGDLGGFCDAVVICWAAVATFVTASTIAAATTRTSACRDIGRHVGSATLNVVWRRAAVVLLRRLCLI